MIAVVGGYGQGLTMRVPRSPDAGETLAGGVLSADHGGKASNQAVAIARLGGAAMLVSAVGDDAAGSAAREFWAAEGVVDRVVTLPGEATMTGFIIVEPSGENRILLADGALAVIAPEHVEGPLSELGEGDLVLVSLEIPHATALRALEVARERGARTVLNPAPASAETRSLVPHADVLTPNRGELAAIVGAPHPATHDALRACVAALGDLGFTGELVVTLGGDGVLVVDADGTELVPPVAVERVVDTTGAGDAFSAALTVALSEGASIREAARFAATAGAFAVTREQVIPSLPYRADLDRQNPSGATS